MFMPTQQLNFSFPYCNGLTFSLDSATTNVKLLSADLHRLGPKQKTRLFEDESVEGDSM